MCINYYCFFILSSVYRGTARMVAESGVALALDKNKLPPMYGVLTPSTAMGTVILERLRNKTVDFYIKK